MIYYCILVIEGLNKVGKILMVVGGIGVLFVVFFVSIDYGEGSFNGDCYFCIVGYSLIMVGVGVGLNFSI